MSESDFESDNLPDLEVDEGRDPNILFACAGIFMLAALYWLPPLIDIASAPLVERWESGYRASLRTPLRPKPPVIVDEFVEVDANVDDAGTVRAFIPNQCGTILYMGTSAAHSMVYPRGCD